MAKVKILQYSTSLDWKDLCNRLLSMVYTDDEARGIKVSHIDNTEARGTFYEYITYMEVIRHPYRGDDEVSHQTYILTDFSLSLRHKTLQIYNSTRRSAALISYIALKLGHDFYISERTIRFERFIEAASSVATSFYVKKVTYPGFAITPKLTAHLTLSSQDDVLSCLPSFPAKLPEAPSRIVFSGEYHGRRMSGAVTKGLLFTISHPDYKDFLRSLFDCTDKLYG